MGITDADKLELKAAADALRSLADGLDLAADRPARATAIIADTLLDLGGLQADLGRTARSYWTLD